MALADLLSSELLTLKENFPRRLFHGRGGLFPSFTHIVIDWYSPVILLICYRLESEELLLQLADELKKYPLIKGVVLQRRYPSLSSKQLLWGEIPIHHIVDECGVLFKVNLEDNLNHGLFFDTYNVRKKVRDLSENKIVLNLFSYTCAFSLYALQGGARRVINMDMSKGALKVGKQNHLLNQMDVKRVTFLDHDIMKSFGKIDRLGPYDLIIIDPPTFQAGSFDYRKDYGKILRRVLPNLAEGGELILCLNCPDESSQFLKNLACEFNLQLKESLPLAEGFAEIDIESGLKAFRVGYELGHQQIVCG